jgi:hypothetical protein
MNTKPFIALVALFFCSTGLQAQQRVALLIGNQSYPDSIGKLSNTHNDIATVADALRRAGFDEVQERKDRKRDDILGDLREFTAALKAKGAGTIGFFYYSGHGAAQKESKRNFILPVDATEPASAELWDSAIPLDEITHRLRQDAPDADHFVIFDSCRNGLQLTSPYVRTTMVDTPRLKQGGMLIAFATEDGHEALDSGVYGKALAEQILQPPQSQMDLFQNVRDKVDQATKGAQVPTELNGFRPRVMLSRPVSTRSAHISVEEKAGSISPAPSGKDSPAIVFAKAARHLPSLSTVYKAEFVSKKPEILRDNGTKKLAAWRINVSYDKSTMETLTRVMDTALSSVAVSSAEGVSFDTNGGKSRAPKTQRIFASNIDYDDKHTIEAVKIYTEAQFGNTGVVEYGNPTDALFKNLNGAVGFADGNVWVLLHKRGNVGGSLKFKAYRVPVQILPFLTDYASGSLALNVTALNSREAEIWSGAVTDFEGERSGITADIIRTMIRGEGPFQRFWAHNELDMRLGDQSPDYKVPSGVFGLTDENMIKDAAESFRKAWLASGYNTPGSTWYSSPKRPTIIFIAPWFVVEDNSNPRGISDGFCAIYSRWLAPDELDGISNLTVSVGD